MNNEVEVSGINKELLEKAIQNLMFYLEMLETRFTQLDSIINSTGHYFDSNCAHSYRALYEELSENYSVVKRNITAYIEDLTNVCLNYEKFELDLAATYGLLNTKNEMDKYERKYELWEKTKD